MEPGYGQQMRRSGGPEILNQVLGKVVAQPQQHGLAHGGLRLGDRISESHADALAHAVQPAVERHTLPLPLAQERGLGKGHDRVYTLARQKCRIVEVPQDGRRLEETFQEQPVPVPEVRPVPLKNHLCGLPECDQHVPSLFPPQPALADLPDGEAESCCGARGLGVGGHHTPDQHGAPSMIGGQ